MSRKKTIVLSILVVILIGLVWFISIQPSNDRGWTLDQKILPSVSIQDNLVTIENVRNFSYTSTSTYTPSYYTHTYDVSKIRSVDFVMEPFANQWTGSAHTFLTFGFENDEYVSISVEIRKEQGEIFSALKGLFKNYELMYVIADERDVIKLRSIHRKDDVYVYPIKASQENIKALFLDMVSRANTLKDNPEFYNSLTNTCTTNIVDHVNKIAPNKIPFSLKILAPGYVDQLVYDLGLIDTDLSLEEARKKYLINEKVLKYAEDPLFSVRIRE